MSKQLVLGFDDLIVIRSSWSDIHANNKYHKDEFISRLYSNLIAANPNLKPIFRNDSIVRKESILFGDLLNYTVIYLHDPKILSEFMFQFCEVNQNFVNNSVQYLEEMGNALIQTFKQWLGNGKFNANLETLWIKVYIYIANNLLQLSTNDEVGEVDSTFSKNDSIIDEEEKEDEIQPLNIKPKQDPTPNPRTCTEEKPPVPIVDSPEQNNLLDKSNFIQFQLSNNEKYRGFRRATQSYNSSSEPISVKIPSLSTFQRVHSPSSIDMPSLPLSSSSLSVRSITPTSAFDPRKARKNSSSTSSVEDSEEETFISRRSIRRSHSVEENVVNEEPVITPRSSRRNSCGSNAIKHDESKPKSQAQQQVFHLRKLKFDRPSKIIADNSDDEFDNVKNKSFGFDPRRSPKRRIAPVRSLSPEESEDEQVGPSKFKSFKKETSEKYSEDFIQSTSINLDSKPEELIFADEFTENDVVPIPERTLSSLTCTAFNQNRFGFKNLDPIVEADYDESSSSKYESDGETSISDYSTGRSSSDSDDVSSGISELSLNNSDYRSSISSGTIASASPSPILNKVQMNTKQESPPRSVSNAQSLGKQLSRISSSRSTTSLLIPRNQQVRGRASLGFMRSSFVLKKEMEQLGYNYPENVFVKPPTIPVAVASPVPEANKNSVLSLSSLSSSDNDGCFDLLNAFVPHSINNSNETKTNQSTKSLSNNKIRSRLNSSIFSKSTSNLQHNSLNYTPMLIDPPKKDKRSIRKRFSISSLFSSSSKSSSSNSSRKSSLMSSSVTDLISINTVDTNSSSISGFSFFSKKRHSFDTRYSSISGERKGNKYNVKSVPYDIFE